MTVLEKKAINYVDEHYEDLDENGFWLSAIRKAYIAGAKESEQMFIDRDRAYQDLINGWTADYRDLEKENEQLKAEIKKLKSTK